MLKDFDLSALVYFVEMYWFQAISNMKEVAKEEERDERCLQ